MTSAVTYYGFLAQRRRRALFLLAPTQHLPSLRLVGEVVRAAAALAAVSLWITFLLVMLD